MTFPLEVLAAAVEDLAYVWTALNLRWQVLPVQPNHGKEFVNAQLESTAWLIEIAIWSSGEAELATIHLLNDRIVNKHYDLASHADLVTLLDELAALLVHDTIPAAAVVFRTQDGGPSGPTPR